jgi:hypothetical protein
VKYRGQYSQVQLLFIFAGKGIQLATPLDEDRPTSATDSTALGSAFPMRYITITIALLAIALPVAGLIPIWLYVVSIGSSPFRYFGVACMAALGAIEVGSLAGGLFGLPRVVGSSTDDRTRGEPSTNLIQVSDWLTKVLLGAGLVQLGQMGRPLSGLVDTLARGLRPDDPQGAPLEATSSVVAGSILAFYFSIGFLNGYGLATMWYQTWLRRLIRGA